MRAAAVFHVTHGQGVPRQHPRFLLDRARSDWPSVEERTIALLPSARLSSYDDYRERFGLPRLAASPS